MILELNVVAVAVVVVVVCLFATFNIMLKFFCNGYKIRPSNFNGQMKNELECICSGCSQSFT